MKRILTAVLTLCILLTMYIPVGATKIQWDLTELPDFTGYMVYDYGYFAAPEVILVSTEEAGLDKQQIQNLTDEVLSVIKDIDFQPVDNADYKQENAVMMLSFVQENWQTDGSDIIHVFVVDDGIGIDVWNRTDNVMHYAFLSCDCEKFMSQISGIMQETVELAELAREQKQQQIKEEKSPNETEITEFTKLYRASVNDAQLSKDGVSEANLDFETGICSYKNADGQVCYGFYYGSSNDSDFFYIADKIDENNLITFNNIQIYKDANDGKYYLYNKDADTDVIKIKINVDADGKLEKMHFLAVNSGYECTVEGDHIIQTGVLKNYGDIKITFAEKAENIPDDTEENTDMTEADTKEENDVQNDKTDDSIEEEQKNTEADEKDVITEQLPEVSKSHADILNELGLFKGTEKGYELEQQFTRAQGATMLVRLLGKEEQALSSETEGVFSDVAADNWAAPYVEYCYNNGITKGTGNNSYSPDEPMSASQYITLVLRALGYESAEPETADLMAVECGMLLGSEALEILQMPVFNRDKMVFISYRALTTDMTDGKTLIEKLIDNKAVDKSTATELGLIN